MRILFVAMADSIHTARWINQLDGQGWDIHLFPVYNGGLHSDLKNLTIHEFLLNRPPGLNNGIHLAGAWPLSRGSTLAKRLVSKFMPLWNDRAWRLEHAIRTLKPDIIHSLEMQHAGYLTLSARNQFTGAFPSWIVSNWGSDIFLFGRLSGHIERIKAVLSACDYYSCECQRDVELAGIFGFEGEVLPVLPNAGGVDIKEVSSYRESGPTSARRLIVLKGYQNWAGRALVGLRAIELAAESIQGYRVAVYVADNDVRIAAELVSKSTGIPIEIIPSCSHKEMLRLHGRARLSIGLSISDAVSTSLLEAMLMGSFPIQSNTSCGNEWIQEGESGLLVHPEDPRSVAEAIRLAVTDDILVDRAADINFQVAAERMDKSVIEPEVINMYEKVLLKGRNTIRGSNTEFKTRELNEVKQ